MYFKIFKEDDNHNGFQYTDGLNEDVLEFNDSSESCVPGGLYFSDEKSICGFLGYGEYIREVEVPSGTLMVRDVDKFRSKRLFLHKRRSLSDVSTWEWMVENGVDIRACDDFALRRSAHNGHLDVVKYLHQNGADIRACDDYALRWSAENGHLEVVKYLHQNGADIRACDDYALQRSAHNGHLDVVKYLHQNGADIRAKNDYALQLSAEYGHLEVVKYLHQNGADIRARYDYALRWSAKNGHLEVTSYIKKQMGFFKRIWDWFKNN